jgi:hypothetical protein
MCFSLAGNLRSKIVCYPPMETLYDPDPPRARAGAWSLLYRFAIVYTLIWTVSWSTVFTRWPLPFERIAAWAPVQHLHRMLTVDVLHLDPDWIGHIALGFTVVIALIIATLWFIVSRDRAYEAALGDLSRTLVRYVLAAAMLMYGVPQLLAVYMRQPGPIDWITRFGEFNPRDVVEYAVGGAPMYESFIGAMHVIAAASLLYRKTTRLGALLVIMATGNTAMILTGYMFGGRWYSYGIATLAGHFQIMAFVLLAPDVQRLLNFFILNREAGRGEQDDFEEGELALSGFSRRLKLVLIGMIAFPPVVRSLEMMNDLRQKSLIYGVYDVEDMQRNGVSLPMTYETPGRWRQVAIDNYADRAVIRLSNGQRLDFWIGDSVSEFATDWRGDRSQNAGYPRGVLALQEMRNRNGGRIGSRAILEYRREGSDLMTIKGKFRGDSIFARLRHIPDTTFKVHHPQWW